MFRQMEYSNIRSTVRHRISVDINIQRPEYHFVFHVREET